MTKSISITEEEHCAYNTPSYSPPKPWHAVYSK
jgi:hypothetical protein